MSECVYPEASQTVNELCAINIREVRIMIFPFYKGLVCRYGFPVFKPARINEVIVVVDALSRHFFFLIVCQFFGHYISQNLIKNYLCFF